MGTLTKVGAGVALFLGTAAVSGYGLDKFEQPMLQTPKGLLQNDDAYTTGFFTVAGTMGGLFSAGLAATSGHPLLGAAALGLTAGIIGGRIGAALAAPSPGYVKTTRA